LLIVNCCGNCYEQKSETTIIFSPSRTLLKKFKYCLYCCDFLPSSLISIHQVSSKTSQLTYFFAIYNVLFQNFKVICKFLGDPMDSYWMDSYWIDRRWHD